MTITSLMKSHLSLLKYKVKDAIFPHPLLEENVRYKNCHPGERCFILGSGPSVVRQDLKKLNGEIVITQNNFHVHPDIGLIHPRYHCVVPFFHAAEFKDDWVEWFRLMQERLPSDAQVFFHLNTQEMLEENNLFPKRTSYLNAGLNPVVMDQACVDITRTIMVVPTVLTQCLTVAIYMGFRKIYLTGFDMDQICHMRERDKLRFYGESPITRNAYELKNDEEHDTTGYVWYHYWTMWKQFILLREEAEHRGTEIINLTDGGLLSCYKRQTYEEIFPKGKSWKF